MRTIFALSAMVLCFSITFSQDKVEQNILPPQNPITTSIINIKPIKPELRIYGTQQANYAKRFDLIRPVQINDIQLDFKDIQSAYQSPIIFERNPYSRDFNMGGSILQWNNGAMFGMGSYNTLVGIGSVGSASIGLTQNFNNLDITIYANADKYNIVHGVHNNFGISATASYRFNNHFTLNVFGRHQNNVNFDPRFRNATPYSSYGMSLTAMLNEKWGADVGMQRVYDPYSRQWRNIPIVAPFFKLGGQKLGFDFGGILYNIFQNLSENFNGSYKNNNNGGFNGKNPTIAPNNGSAFHKWTNR